ncbi:MAG TPA: hypothetical protein VHE83_15815 [Mycobacteriales bacterium]|nr:hypothetical protein [Mycobacteriales bacterium]
MAWSPPASAQSSLWAFDQPAAGSCGATSGGQIIGAQTLGWADGALSGGTIDGYYGPVTQGAINHMWNVAGGGSHQSGCMDGSWYSAVQTVLSGTGSTHPSMFFAGSHGSAYFDYSHTGYAPSGCTWTTDDYHTGLPMGGGLGLGHYVWVANIRYSTSVAGYANC